MRWSRRRHRRRGNDTGVTTEDARELTPYSGTVFGDDRTRPQLADVGPIHFALPRAVRKVEPRVRRGQFWVASPRASRATPRAMVEPLRLLDDFIGMYSARAGLATEERDRCRRPMGVFVDASAGRIVPDMDVFVADVETLAKRLDRGKAGADAALRMLAGATEDQVALGVVFDDGDCLLALVQIHRTVDVRP